MKYISVLLYIVTTIAKTVGAAVVSIVYIKYIKSFADTGVLSSVYPGPENEQGYIRASFLVCAYWGVGLTHDRPWISSWIKSISNELDIIIHVITPQLPGHCDVISNRLWHHQQNANQASETRCRCVRSSFFSSFMDLLCSVRNKMMYALSWRTVFALTRLDCLLSRFFRPRSKETLRLGEIN